MFFLSACGNAAQNYQLHAVTISRNTAGGDGGGIYTKAPLTIDNAGGPTVISQNTAGHSGGGIWLQLTNNVATISKVTLTDNSAADSGGGIRAENISLVTELNLSYSRIFNNSAGAHRK